MTRFWAFFLLVFFMASGFGFGEVVINELNYDPSDEGEEGGALREFIELYNPGSTPTDLSGYAFTSGIQYTFPQGTLLNANSYLVVVRVPTLDLWRRTSYPVFGPYEGKLSNGGEKITLQKSDGMIVEQFTYDDDIPWPRGADGYGPSLERISWDLPADDYHSWRTSLVDNGTPGSRNSVVGTAPRPMISAFDLIPKHPTSFDDVQIQIGLDSPELIATAYLQWETDAKTQIQGIVNADSSWKSWKGTQAPSPNQEWTSLSFNDSSWNESQGGFGYGDLEQVNTELLDMRGNYSTFYTRQKFTVADPASLGNLSLTIFYDDGFVCYLNGVEVGRKNAPAPYTHQSVASGSHESDTSETLELGSATTLLQKGENVIALVGLNITLGNSTDFVLAPTLRSSAQSGGNQQIPMTLISEWVSGATYSAILPAQDNQTLVRYNLRVDLKDGNTLLLPHTAERRPFESYFVYDNDVPTHLPILWLFPDRISHLPERSGAYSCVVAKPLGDLPVQVFDGAAITLARNGHKIKFLKGEEFREDRTINLSLESPRVGTTAGPQSPHVEQISYQLFEDFGALTPRCDWYRVIENNSHSQRIAVQQPNEQFLKVNERDAEGNIYKIAYNEPGGYSKKTNLDEGDDDYRELFQHVNTSNRTNLVDAIQKYLVYEEVMGYQLATFLLSHWDGIKNNIFLYHDPQPEGKWEIIPWDVDKTFGYTDSNPMYWEMPIDFFITGQTPTPSELIGRNLNGPISRPFHSVPQFQQDFVNRVAESMEGLFSLQRVGNMIDEAEQLLLADLNLQEEYTNKINNTRRNQIITSYDTMRFFMEKRHQFLRTQLPAGFTVERSLLSRDFHSGETLPNIAITVNPLGGKTLQALVTEQIPDRFTLSNLQATQGEFTFTENAITWNLADLTTQAQLTYDLTAPESSPPARATLQGTIIVGDIVYSIGDVELKYMPDNVSSLGPDWAIGMAGEWTIIDGVLNCYANDGTDPKHVWVNKNFGTGDYTVKADVRMVDWENSDSARAGIAVRVNPTDGERALNLLFHEDTNSVDMLNDLVAWGTQGDTEWTIGEWYTMTLTATGSELEGQFQKKDSNQAPLILTWNDSRIAARSPGYPGLTGSSMQDLTSQYDNFEVLINGKVVFSDNFDPETIITDWPMY